MADVPSTVDPAKTGQEWMEIISRHPTLDILLNRSPSAIPYTDAELLRIVEIQRAERALFNIKEQARKDKKAGVVPEVEGEKEEENE